MKNLVTVDRFDLGPFSFFGEFERDMRQVLDSMIATKNSETSLTKDIDFLPSCELMEQDSQYVLSFDLPGIPKKDIHIEAQNSQLKILGERKMAKEKMGYCEKSYGNFERTVSLPKGIREDEIKASYRDGVLTLTLPKSQKVLPKKIEIAH